MNVLINTINLGQPPFYDKPRELISGLLEDLAFRLSKETQKKNLKTLQSPGSAGRRTAKNERDNLYFRSP